METGTSNTAREIRDNLSATETLRLTCDAIYVYRNAIGEENKAKAAFQLEEIIRLAEAVLSREMHGIALNKAGLERARRFNGLAILY